MVSPFDNIADSLEEVDGALSYLTGFIDASSHLSTVLSAFFKNSDAMNSAVETLTMGVKSLSDAMSAITDSSCSLDLSDPTALMDALNKVADGEYAVANVLSDMSVDLTADADDSADSTDATDNTANELNDLTDAKTELTETIGKVSGDSGNLLGSLTMVSGLTDRLGNVADDLEDLSESISAKDSAGELTALTDSLKAVSEAENGIAEALRSLAGQ